MPNVGIESRISMQKAGRAFAWQGVSTHFVAGNLPLSVILKVAVPLEAALHKLAELGSKQLAIVQMVDTQAGA